MSDLLERLQRKERRGSKPRCHLLTHGSAEECAARLTGLAAPFATVSVDGRWMPSGFDDTQEAELDKAPSLLAPEIRSALASWWLAPRSRRARTPNFDIASTCSIDGRPGLLLVEAKAHDEELTKEAAGRKLAEGSSGNRKASHETIANAILSACAGLSEATSLPWRIARDTHYQMSNRFAWAWKLATLGVPVVLVYLGFLRANEMADLGQPFRNHEDWERLVRAHSEPLVPPQVWERSWTVSRQTFVPLIRSVEQPLDLELPP